MLTMNIILQICCKIASSWFTEFSDSHLLILSCLILNKNDFVLLQIAYIWKNNTQKRALQQHCYKFWQEPDKFDGFQRQRYELTNGLLFSQVAQIQVDTFCVHFRVHFPDSGRRPWLRQLRRGQILRSSSFRDHRSLVHACVLL